MSRSRLVIVLAVVTACAGAATLAVGGLRWRAHVLLLKATGGVPEVGWRELIPMLRPRSGFYLATLAETRNPHSSILAPDSSAAARTRGAELFRSHCASCHGAEAEGLTAPALWGAGLRHGRSDWALYRALSRGIPGTAMQPVRLSRREGWQIVAYVKMLRNAEGRKPSEPVRARLDALPPVSARALERARETPADWLTYSGSYDGKRFSPLDEIHTGNVARLSLRWIHQLADPDPKLETSPIVLSGVMFLTTPGNGVRALDAAAGTLLWSYDREQTAGLMLCCSRINRGVAVLDSTLYLATQDAHLVALDFRTGAIRWDVAVADRREGYSFTSAPLAVGDLVVIGNSGGEYPTRGFIDAYDARTGERRWRFRTIPDPGEPGHETWGGDSWRTGGTPAWLTGSYDPALDLLYWGIGNPNPDYNGDGRPGDNLYSNSVVALEAQTGRLRWYFQFTPHDLYDWDAAQIPVLADLPGPEGAVERLLFWANRNAFYYVLDRVSGRFLLGRPFVEQTWADGLDSAGRPVPRPGMAPSRAGALVAPASATNWWSPSYSPRTGLFYVPAYEGAAVFYKGAVTETGGARLGSASQQNNPRGSRLVVRALQGRDGVRRWEYELFRELPEAEQAVGGLLSTAGDLLFAGGADRFVALDARTGRLLWSFAAGGPIMAAPVSYQAGGRQQVSIAAGRAILTFSLDRGGLSARP